MLQTVVVLLLAGLVYYFLKDLWALSKVIYLSGVLYCFFIVFKDIYSDRYYGFKYWFYHVCLFLFLLSTPHWASYIIGRPGTLGMISWPTEREQAVLDSLYQRSEMLWQEEADIKQAKVKVKLDEDVYENSREIVLAMKAVGIIDNEQFLQGYIETAEKHNEMLGRFSPSFVSHYRNDYVVTDGREIKISTTATFFWLMGGLFMLMASLALNPYNP